MQIYFDEILGFDCGVDEAGRGPWAGPVVAAAVILPVKFSIDNIDDSKKLSKKQLEVSFKNITRMADFGIGYGSVKEIDSYNILQATFLAMRRAISNLKSQPSRALIDGNIVPSGLLCPAKSIVKGDSKVASIAAASIVAKVTRDRMMLEYDKIFPGYGLLTNMGYGTKEHISAIKNSFSTPIHRQSFKPILDYMPKFRDIIDIGVLSIELAACKMVKSGHKIIRIKDKSLQSIDVISLFDQQYFGFKLHSSNRNLENIKNNMIKDMETFFLEDGIKKDITSSINISVISVEFSKNKPKVIFKNI